MINDIYNYVEIVINFSLLKYEIDLSYSNPVI